MTRFRLLTLATLLLNAAIAPGCSSTSCTEIACADQLTVELSAPIELDASARLELEVEGHFETCALDANSTRCGSTVLVVENGKLEALWIVGSPRDISVHVFRGDVEIVDRAFTNIQYDNDHPNGEDCDAEACRQATVEI